METYENLFLHCLKKQPRVGNITILKLIEYFGTINSLINNYKLTKDINAELKKSVGLAIEAIDKERILIEKQQINLINLLDKDYPDMLKQIYNPPAILYYKGILNPSRLTSSISVVGTRKATSYGIKVTEEVCAKLSGIGLGIVSGLAIGIDKIAHETAISNNGYTVAILAADVAKASPACNYSTYKKILDGGGLIISEFFDSSILNPGLFALRNRIVAGISKGTLVTEADINSGALITADLAFENGRELFAVPGSIYNNTSRGTHLLIKDNKAKLISCADDVLFELGYIKKKSLQAVDNSAVKDLSGKERIIYDILLNQACFIDEIVLKSSLSLQEVVSCCTMLELKKIIYKLDSNKYSLAFN